MGCRMPYAPAATSPHQAQARPAPLTSRRPGPLAPPGARGAGKLPMSPGCRVGSWWYRGPGLPAPPGVGGPGHAIAVAHDEQVVRAEERRKAALLCLLRDGELVVIRRPLLRLDEQAQFHSKPSYVAASCMNRRRKYGDLAGLTAGEDDLVRHLLAPGFLGRQQAATHIRRRSSEGGRPRFKGRHLPVRSLTLGALTRLAAVAISFGPLPNLMPAPAVHLPSIFSFRTTKSLEGVQDGF